MRTHENMKPALFVFTAAIAFSVTQTLECGISMQNSNKELQKIVQNCVGINLVKVDTSNETSSTEDETDSTESLKSLNETSDYKKNEQLIRKGNGNSDENITMDKDICIVHCILQQLNLTNNNGFPDHQSISRALVKTAEGRELLDFIEDSTDECFQQIDQAIRDPCIFSNNLVTCLADKGRNNCADWPVEANLSAYYLN